MIKVGQVFKYDKDETSRIVITLKSLSGVTIICNDGSAGSEIKEKHILENWTLVKDFPTWIDAINSKEFKGE